MKRLIVFYCVIILVFFVACHQINNKKEEKTLSNKISEAKSYWSFLEDRFLEVSIDSTLCIHNPQDIISHANRNKVVNKISRNEMDSLLENVLYELIEVKAAIHVDFAVGSRIYGYSKENDLYLIFYGKTLLHKYETINVAIFKKNKMVSKIQLGKSTLDLSEMHCSTISSDLIIKRCLNYQYPLEKKMGESLYHEYYKIEKSGKIVFNKIQRLHPTSSDKCICRNQ